MYLQFPLFSQFNAIHKACIPFSGEKGTDCHGHKCPRNDVDNSMRRRNDTERYPGAYRFPQHRARIARPCYQTKNSCDNCSNDTERYPTVYRQQTNCARIACPCYGQNRHHRSGAGRFKPLGLIQFRVRISRKPAERSWDRRCSQRCTTERRCPYQQRARR